MSIDKSLEAWTRKRLLDKNGRPQGRSLSSRRAVGDPMCAVLDGATSFLPNGCSAAERVYCVLHSVSARPVCVCGKPLGFRSYAEGYSNYCSSKCAMSDPLQLARIEKTNIERHGVESPAQSEKVKAKMRETNMRRRGVDNPFQSEDVKAKSRATNMERRGVEFPTQSDDVKRKSCETMVERYGAEHSLQSEMCKDRFKATCEGRFGVDNPFKSEGVREKIKATNKERYGHESPLGSMALRDRSIVKRIDKHGVRHNKQVGKREQMSALEDRGWLLSQHHDLKKTCSQIASEIGVTKKTVANYCRLHGIDVKNYFVSAMERGLADYVSSLGMTVRCNDRSVIGPREVDVYVPDFGLAIEFDGLFWHSYGELETPLQKMIHLEKTLTCATVGVSLLHVFENEWTDDSRRAIWQSMIASRLGSSRSVLHARKMDVVDVLPAAAEKFLAENHLQGPCRGRVRLGLCSGDDLVALMVFGKSRFRGGHEWEMLRFCTKIFTNVAGAAGKLFKHFVRSARPASVVSYANRRYSSGGLYGKIGFELSHASSPGYFYYDARSSRPELLSRVGFQKHKLEGKIKEFNRNLSEAENMFANGYRRIWDCGNLVYVWRR